MVLAQKMAFQAKLINILTDMNQRIIYIYKFSHFCITSIPSAGCGTRAPASNPRNILRENWWNLLVCESIYWVSLVSYDLVV